MTEQLPPRKCIDCGKPSSGFRCKNCHGRYIAAQALTTTAERDQQILAAVDDEHLSGQRLADRFGISRTRARKLITTARSREQRRQVRA